MLRITSACAALLTACTTAAIAADNYPSKTIRVVHGYATASSMDINSRAIANKLSEYLGQQVVVDARPGATGTIAAELVAKSAPDGYTLLAAPGSSVAATPHMQKVRFDPLKDFAPVAPIGDFAYLLAAHPNLPARTIRELVTLGKKQPGKLSYGSNGSGSAYHLAGVLLCMMADIDMLHVPYRGGGTSALTDLATGRVDMMWNNPVFLLPHVRTGKLRAMAITGEKRVAAMPDVPTIGETVKGYEISGWQGMLAPAGTPKDVVAKLDAAIQRALNSPDVKNMWNTQGMDTVFTTPEQFTQRIRADYERYGKLVKKMGDKLD
jgi:tripartite-type tricarboxylate transporter receptor subunit TctC